MLSDLLNQNNRALIGKCNGVLKGGQVTIQGQIATAMADINPGDAVAFFDQATKQWVAIGANESKNIERTQTVQSRRKRTIEKANEEPTYITPIAFWTVDGDEISDIYGPSYSRKPREFWLGGDREPVKITEVPNRSNSEYRVTWSINDGIEIPPYHNADYLDAAGGLGLSFTIDQNAPELFGIQYPQITPLISGSRLFTPSATTKISTFIYFTNIGAYFFVRSASWWYTFYQANHFTIGWDNSVEPVDATTVRFRSDFYITNNSPSVNWEARRLDINLYTYFGSTFSTEADGWLSADNDACYFSLHSNKNLLLSKDTKIKKQYFTINNKNEVTETPTPNERGWRKTIDQSNAVDSNSCNEQYKRFYYINLVNKEMTYIDIFKLAGGIRSANAVS